VSGTGRSFPGLLPTSCAPSLPLPLLLLPYPPQQGEGGGFWGEIPKRWRHNREVSWGRIYRAARLGFAGCGCTAGMRSESTWRPSVAASAT
jgi:hypothetical protein